MAFVVSGNSPGGLYRLTNALCRLYSTPSLELTVTSLPSLVCTVYGSLSKFASSLPDVFMFFSKTRSPGVTGLLVAPHLLSGCSSWINMWFQSRSLTPSSNRFPAHLNSGGFVFNSLSNLACCQHVPRGSTCDSNNDLWPTHPTGFQRNLTLEALFSTLCQTQGMQE